jgi:nicotinate-nucleotide--dimethylbenzimidazole phosphoribosyltransferase
MTFKSFDELRDACADLPTGNEAAVAAVEERQSQLTKPAGSLGRLETLVAWLARWQGRDMPKLDRVKVAIFAGSHGVTARGVSAFPSEVTAQMVGNFANGGAAINQLARAAGAELEVQALDIDQPTGDFTVAPAMDEAAFLDAVSKGAATVSADLDLICLGEMGIGNTTTAAALSAALFGGTGADWVGRGTGVDDHGLTRKAEAVDAALAHHGAALRDPLHAAALVGGRELAAMFGAALAARKLSVPVIVDGFVSTAAVAPLAKLHPQGLAHAVAGHASAEAAHRNLLAKLDMPPLLDLGMRLGEGSGACLAVNLLRSALACHSGMATFAEAAVSGKG